MQFLNIPSQYPRLAYIVPQVARPHIDLLIVNQRQQFAQHFSVALAPGDNREADPFSHDLAAIAITNPAAAPQGTYCVGFDPFEICDVEALIDTCDQLREEREDAAATKRPAVEDQSISERESWYQEPGHGDKD